MSLGFDNGIGNIFDEGDDGGHFALERVEDTPALRRERAAFLLCHSPDTYPAAELRGDIDRLLTPPSPPKRAFKVGLRGSVSAYLSVTASDEDGAERAAKTWMRGGCDWTDAALSDFGVDFFELDGTVEEA